MDFRLSELKNNMVIQNNKNNLVANNLANANTTGFKKDIPFFELLKNKESSRMKMNSYRDYSQGALKDTGNPLDMAITGEGFFTIDTDGDTKYTRDGHFTVDSEGFLVTKEGYGVLGHSGLINVSIDGQKKSELNINSSGEIFADSNLIGKLLISRLPEDGKINKGRGNFFTYSGRNYPEIVDEPNIVQGKLEGSNINPVKEMVQLIELKRNFESAQRTIKALDRVLGDASSKLSRY